MLFVCLYGFELLQVTPFYDPSDCSSIIESGQLIPELQLTAVGGYVRSMRKRVFMQMKGDKRLLRSYGSTMTDSEYDYDDENREFEENYTDLVRPFI